MSSEQARNAGSALFRQCYETAATSSSNISSTSIDDVMLCVVNGLEAQQAEYVKDTHQWMFVICGALVLLMQAGFAMLCAGCVRRKNVSNTLLKNLLDACAAGVSFFSIGFAFAFGGDDPENGFTFVGTQNFFMMGDIDYGFWFYEFAFSAACVTIIAGTLAERSRMSAYVAYSLFMTAFVYPIVAHSIWSANGFLSAFAGNPLLGIGCIDFAGSGCVHLTGGTTAMIATLILGARRGRFTNSKGEPLDRPRDIAGHSISLQTLGTLLLWFSWYGFNSGSALLLNIPNKGEVATIVAVNTSLAAAAGSVSSLLTNYYIGVTFYGETRIDVAKTLNGCLAGLVAVTSACGTIEPWCALMIGMIAGWIYLGASELLVRLRIDDAVDGIPIHMFCGAWGLIATGLFSSPNKLELAFGTDLHPGLFYSIGALEFSANLLACQVAGMFFIVGWTTALMLPFFLLLNHFDWLRVATMEELAGLDAAYAHATQEDHEELKEKM
ncbi:ammonium transmembrane transporter [Mayamaea pseudoterrestris]|nr:ammonium transmembrane transporter [Mayamaea pseudoterrestris]